METVVLDLDDTLMKCGVDYGRAIEKFGEYINDMYGIEKPKAIDVANKIDSNLVDVYGVSKKRFPESLIRAHNQLTEPKKVNGKLPPVEVQRIGESVFKSTGEYEERGLMDGALDLLHHLESDESTILHLATEGDKEVQWRKISGLGIELYFDDIHVITEVGGKEAVLRRLVERSCGSDTVYMVGNSLKSDIKPAVNAGARAVYLKTHEWQSTENREYYENHDCVAVSESVDGVRSSLHQIGYHNQS